MRRIFKTLPQVHWLYSVLWCLVLLIYIDVISAITFACMGTSTWRATHLYLIGGLWVLAAATMLIMLYLHLLEDRQVFKRRSEQPSSSN